MRLRPESFVFTVFLSALGGMTSLSIDMGLPALADIGQALHVSAATAGLTLSVFLAGFSAGPIMLGPLSDRHGRRPVLLATLLLLAGAGAGCTMARTLPWLLFWRLFAGIGAGGAGTLSLAIVRDLFDGIAARVKLSYVSTVGTLAPMIAPTLGTIILAFAGWRAIYATLAVTGFLLLAIVAFGFTESLAEVHPAAMQPRRLAANYARFFGNRICLGYALVGCLSFGGLFSYISSSPLVMMGVMRVPRSYYGWTFALTAFGIMAGAFASGKLSARAVPSSRLLAIGLTTSVASALAVAALVHSGWLNLWDLMPLLVLNTFSAGLIGPNATQGALHPMPDIAGVASAVLGSSRMLTGALASVLIAIFFDGRTAHAMGTMMSLFTMSSLAAFLFLVRPAERRMERAARVGEMPLVAAAQDVL